MKLRNSHAVRFSARVSQRGNSLVIPTPRSQRRRTNRRQPSLRVRTAPFLGRRKSLPKPVRNGRSSTRVLRGKMAAEAKTSKKVLRSRNLNATTGNVAKRVSEPSPQRNKSRSKPDFTPQTESNPNFEVPKCSIAAESSTWSHKVSKSTATVSLREIVSEIEKESISGEMSPPHELPSVSEGFHDPHAVDLSAYEEFDFLQEEDEYCPNGVFDSHAKSNLLFSGSAGLSSDWIPQTLSHHTSSSTSYANSLSPLLNFCPTSNTPCGAEYNQLLPSYVYNQVSISTQSQLEIVPSSSSPSYYNNNINAPDFMTQDQQSHLLHLHHHQATSTSSLYTLQNESHSGNSGDGLPIYNYYTSKSSRPTLPIPCFQPYL